MRLSYDKITMQPTQAILNFLAARLKQCGVRCNNLFYLAEDMQTIPISMCNQNYANEGFRRWLLQ